MAAFRPSVVAIHGERGDEAQVTGFNRSDTDDACVAPDFVALALERIGGAQAAAGFRLGEAVEAESFAQRVVEPRSHGGQGGTQRGSEGGTAALGFGASRGGPHISQAGEHLLVPRRMRDHGERIAEVVPLAALVHGVGTRALQCRAGARVARRRRRSARR